MSSAATPSDTPEQRNAPDKAAAIFKLLLGVAFAAATVYLVDLHSRQAPSGAAGAITGIAAGLALALIGSGAANLAGKRMPKFAGIAVVVLCAVAGGMIEPKHVEQRRVQIEQAAWDRLQASGKTFADYQAYQFCGAPTRAGYEPGMALAQVREEIARMQTSSGQRVATLRRLISECRNKAPDNEPAAMKPAIDLARAELSKAYAAGLDNLAKRAEAAAGGKPPEFAADPQMRAAFKTILERLAQADDDYVYLVFKGDTDVSPPAAATGAATPRTLDSGDAFTPARENKRQRAFVKAMEESIERGFAEPLLRLRDLDDKPRAGKVIFEVACTTRRAPGGFELTINEKPIGTLFNLDVAWKFQIFDVDGKPLATNQSRSNPAEKLSFKLNKSDPTWAAYSVMMDSAYYNYCRQITGRLGLTPPLVREYFSFDR